MQKCAVITKRKKKIVVYPQNGKKVSVADLYSKHQTVSPDVPRHVESCINTSFVFWNFIVGGREPYNILPDTMLLLQELPVRFVCCFLYPLQGGLKCRWMSFTLHYITRLFHKEAALPFGASCLVGKKRKELINVYSSLMASKRAVRILCHISPQHFADEAVSPER